MVETIAPVVYGKRSSYIVAVAFHTIAATLTAAGTGALLGAIGLLLGGPWGTVGAIAVAGVAFVYLLRETLGLPIPLPQARRQVPEWWRTFFSPPVAASLYGAGLGVAFLTFLSYGTFAAVAAGAVASADPLVGALICGPFGLARGLAVAAVGWRSTDPNRTVTGVATVGSTRGPRVLNALMLAIVGALALFQVV